MIKYRLFLHNYLFKKYRKPLLAVGVTLIVIFVFYGRSAPDQLATQVPQIIDYGRTKNQTVKWNIKQPNVLIIDITPDEAFIDRGMLDDTGKKYYTKFFLARRAAGYPLWPALNCSIYLRTHNFIAARTSFWSTENSDE